MQDEDLIDFDKFFRKHQSEFDTYSEAQYFGMGFFIGRGFSWTDSAKAVRQELVQLW